MLNVKMISQSAITPLSKQRGRCISIRASETGVQELIGRAHWITPPRINHQEKRILVGFLSFLGTIMKMKNKLSICQLCFAHQIRQLTEHRRKTLYGFIGGFSGISKLGHHYMMIVLNCCPIAKLLEGTARIWFQ